jgi:STE24 endopeptidase
VNEPRASRYHRLKRRAACGQVALAAALLGGLLWSGGSLWLRGLTGGVAAYALVLAVALEVVMLPLAWYRTFVVERQYGLVRASLGDWLRDYGRGVALSTGAAVLASDLLYRAIAAWPHWWWAAGAGGGVLLAALAMWVAPVAILPLFQRSRPLGRDALRERLANLTHRIGVETPVVHESSAAAHERRAHASFVGVGGTRRVLLSATLLDDYSEDEIEAVLAHEIGHHVHRDVLSRLGAELVVLLAGLLAAWAALGQLWGPLGLSSPGDAAGLPLLLLVAGGTRLLAIPLLNALSRRHERRADRFALQALASPEGFIGAVRRMAAQNLAEERPSRAVVWLFHTHPTVEERIAAARRTGGRDVRR